MIRAAPKDILSYCQGWECITEALAHPNSPGWGQTFGSLIAVGVAIWVASFQIRQNRRDKYQEHLEIKKVGLGFISFINIHIGFCIDRIRKDGGKNPLVFDEARKIARLRQQIDKIDISVLPDQFFLSQLSMVVENCHEAEGIIERYATFFRVPEFRLGAIRQLEELRESTDRSRKAISD